VSAKHVGAGEEIINTNAACEVVHNKNCNACISEMVASFDQRIQVLEKHIHNCEVSVAAVGPQLAGVQHDIRRARQEIDNACAAAKADHVEITQALQRYLEPLQQRCVALSMCDDDGMGLHGA